METENFDQQGGDRYQFDFDLCSVDRGWAQVDTWQDAWYCGTWAHPERLKVVTYTEGDVTVRTAADGEEFAAELRRVAEWHGQHGGFKGIDHGERSAIRQAFIRLGLADLFHASDPDRAAPAAQAGAGTDAQAPQPVEAIPPSPAG